MNPIFAGILIVGICLIGILCCHVMIGLAKLEMRIVKLEAMIEHITGKKP